MATRDIDLVIRARNEASKAIESVGDALGKLKAAQDAASASATKTGAGVDRLKADLEALANQEAVLTALTRVAAQLERAEKIATKAAEALPKLREEEARLGNEAKVAADKHAELVQKVTAADAALKEKSAGAKASKEEFDKLTSSVTKAEKSLERLEKRKGKLSPENADGLAKLQAEGQAATQKLTELQKQLDATRKRYDDLKASRDAASAAKKDLTAQEAASSQTARGTLTAAGRATSAREAGEERANKTAEALADIKAVAAPAAAALGNVALKQDELGKASARTAALIKQTTAAIEAERSAAAKVQAPSGSTDGRRRLVDYRLEREAIASATTALEESRDRTQATRDEATRLGKELATSGTATADLASRFNLAKIESDKARDAYYEQAKALRVLVEAENARAAAARQSAEYARAQERASAIARIGSPTRSAMAQVMADAEAEQIAAAQLDASRRRGISDAMIGGARSGTRTFAQADSHVEAFKAAQTAAEGAKRAEDAFNRSSEAMRRSGSVADNLAHRLRTLATLYFGLHAAASQFHSIIETIRVLDAAQNRLGVVFEGDVAKTGQEIVFLQAQASRLGISFGTLLDQYARVSLATKEVGASTEETRKIFMAFAETGRVAKLSTNEMQRMFLAIDEMMSRGKIQSKELRQLSYTIAGAPEIVAKSLGMTMAELTAAMKSGEVEASVSNMMKIAEGLTQRYGAQLPEALKTTTTEIGRLENTAFRLREAFAEGGFSNALRDMLHGINEEAEKPATRQFFRDLGAGAGSAIGAIVELSKYVKEIGVGLAALAAYAAAGRVLAFFSALAAMSGPILAVVNAVRLAATGVIAWGAASATAISVFGRFIPVIGQVITAIGLLAAAYQVWSRASKAPVDVNVLAKHKEQLESLQRAYEDNGKSLEGWQAKAKNIDATGVSKSFEDIQKLFREKVIDFSKTVEIPLKVKAQTEGSGLSSDEMKKTLGLIRQLDEGRITFAQLTQSIKEMQIAASSGKASAYFSEWLAQLPKMVEWEDHQRKAAALALEMGVSVEEAQKVLQRYGGTIKEIVAPTMEADSAHRKEAEAAERVRKAMDDLDKVIEKSTPNQKKMETAADAVTAALEAEADAADSATKALLRRKAEQAALQAARKKEGVKGAEAEDLDQNVPTQAQFEAQSIIDKAEAQAKAEKKAQEDEKEARRKAKEQAKAQETFDTSFDIDLQKRQFKGAQGEELNAAKARLKKAQETGVGVDAAQSQVNAIQRQQFIDKAVETELEKAKSKDVSIDSGRLEKIREIAAQEYDQLHALDEQEQRKQRLADAEKRLGDLVARRKAIEESIQYNKEHPFEQPATPTPQLQAELKGVTEDASKAADEVERLAKGLDDKKALDNLRNTRTQLIQEKQSLIDLNTVGTDFANGFTGAIGKAADAIGGAIGHTKKWKSAWDEVRNAFLNFAADFLKQMGMMLVRKALFGALGLEEGKGKGGAGEGGGGGLAGALQPFFKTGSGGTESGLVSVGSASATGGGLLGSIGDAAQKTVAGAKAEIASQTAGAAVPSGLRGNQLEAYRAARAEGLSDSSARALVANMSGEALHKPNDVHPDPSRSNPNQKAHGIVQWDDERAARIKAQFGKAPQDMSVGDQTRAAIWEINNRSEYAPTKKALASGDAGSALEQLVRNYERPADSDKAIAQRKQYLNKLDFGSDAGSPLPPERPSGLGVDTEPTGALPPKPEMPLDQAAPDVGGLLSLASAFGSYGLNKRSGGGGAAARLPGLIGMLPKLLKLFGGGGLGGAGGGIGGLFSMVASIFHEGGSVGSSSPSRLVDSSIFASAVRMHAGNPGVGLKPNEVPAILEKGEKVLSKDVARQGGRTGGSTAAGKTPLKIVNAIHPGDALSHALDTAEGEEAFLNFVRINSSSIKGALG